MATVDDLTEAAVKLGRADDSDVEVPDDGWSFHHDDDITTFHVMG